MNDEIDKIMTKHRELVALAASMGIYVNTDVESAQLETEMEKLETELAEIFKRRLRCG